MMFKWHKNIQNRQNLQSIISRKNFGILLILFLTLNMLFYSNNIFGLNLGGFLTNTGDVQALKDAAKGNNNDEEEATKVKAERGELPKGVNYYTVNVSNATGNVIIFKAAESEDEYKVSIDGGKTYKIVKGEIAITGTMPDEYKLIMGEDSEKEEQETATEGQNPENVENTENKNESKKSRIENREDSIENKEKKTEQTTTNSSQNTKSVKNRETISNTSVTWNGYNTSSRVQIQGTVTIVLADGSTNVATSGIEVNDGNTLEIDSALSGTYNNMGILRCEYHVWDSGNNNAGCVAMGGSNANIIINGGEIKIFAGDSSGSGVGSVAIGSINSGSNITINGGNIEAYPSYYGYNDNSVGIGSIGSNTSVSINGGIIKTSGEYVGVGIGSCMSSSNTPSTISITGTPQIFAGGNSCGIGSKDDSVLSTISISNTAKVVMATSDSGKTINANVSGDVPAIIGGVINGESWEKEVPILREEPSFIFFVRTSESTVCNEVEVRHSDIHYFNHVALTTAGSTGTKYIQVEIQGAYIPIAKVSSVSSLANYQYNSTQSITPTENNMYLAPVSTKPTIDDSDGVLGFNETATLTAGNNSNLWQKTNHSTTKWDDMDGYFNSNHNLGTGNSVTLTTTGHEGCTTVRTIISNMELVGTNITIDVASEKLLISVTDGEYDLSNSNVNIYHIIERGSIRVSNGNGEIWLPESYPVTIYQSNDGSSTTHTLDIYGGYSNNANNSINIILGKEGNSINGTYDNTGGYNYHNAETITIYGQKVNFILPDGITNTITGMLLNEYAKISILTEQQFEDPSHSGNYEGMGTLIANEYGIRSNNSSNGTDINVKGGHIVACIGTYDEGYGTVDNIVIDGGSIIAESARFGIGGYRGTVGNITINGGTVVAKGADVGIGASYDCTVNNIVIAEGARVLAISEDTGIKSNATSIADTANVMVILERNSTTNYFQGISGQGPATIGGYLRTDSGRVNAGDTINIMESNGNILNTFEIPSDINVTTNTLMAFTTAGSTGTKYIQAVRNGNQVLASKVSPVSTTENYQYNSERTTAPYMNELYLGSDVIMAAPTVNSGGTESGLGWTATLTEGQINNLWEKTANSVTTWNESGGLFSNNHNLGTGNSVTITSLGVEGSTEITTTVSEVRLIGTNLVCQVTSPALTMTVAIGKYDLSYGNIEVSEEEGYDFKVNFTDENGINRVEYFESGRTITIYQSDGENSTTANTINLNTDRVDVILGKTGSPINTTNSINCNGVAGSENSIRLILPDGITNKISGQLDSSGINVTNDSSLTILTEQQFADPSYSGNYEGMGTLISTGGSNGSGIGSGNNNSDGKIQINGGNIIAIGGSNQSAILLNSISINNNSKLLAIGNNTPIAATAADTASDMIGGYIKTDSNYVNSGDTINIIESDGSVLNTFEIPADISITANTRMVFTTAGSTGIKYIQAVRNGKQILASKVSPVSNLANYQYNSTRTLTPDMNDLYLVPAVTIDAPSISTGNTEINSGDTVTFNAAEAQISNLWEAVGDITWNDSEGLFNSSHNLGTGNSVTTTSLRIIGSTDISTNAEVRLVGTNVTISAKSSPLTVRVKGGEYDLRYGNIEVSEEEGYEFKVSFKDSSSASKVEYFVSNEPITIYQSNGESSTTSNAVNLNTDRVDVILGKTGSPINTTSSISCNGVSGSENSIRLILADGVTNTIRGSSWRAAIYIMNASNLNILTERQFGDPSHSGNYEGMGTLAATGGASAAGIGCGDDNYQTIGDITINGGTVTATGSYRAAGIGCGSSSNQSIGSITINGGVVTAQTGGAAAGIGCGMYDSQSIGDITINGGTVTATVVGSWGAGIGGGDGNNQTIGDITINGGTVTATGDKSGIGYSSAQKIGNIGISEDSKVFAIGSYYGIAIGSNSESGTISISNTASVVAVAKGTYSSYVPIQGTVSGTAPAMIGAYLRTSSDRVKPGDTVNIMESDGTILHTFEIPTSITTASQMAITTAGSTGTKYIQAVRDGATILASKTSSVSNLANYQYNSSETISPAMNELYLVSVIAAPTISNAVLGLNDTATLTMGDTSNTSLWETTENSVITWNDSEGLFNSQHNLGEGDSITVTAQGTEGNTKITATISEMQLVGTNIKSNVSSNSLQVAVTDGEYDLYYGDISITKQDNNTFKLAYRDENNTSKILYLPNDYTITVYQSNGENTSTTNVINVGGTSYSSTVGTSAAPIKLILGKPGSPVNIAATSTATKPCLAVMGNSYLKLILPDNVVNILDNSYGNGEGLTSSTRYPSSAIRVAKYSSYIAHLEITTPDGSNGTGKLVAKAGYDAAAIGGFANSSSVGYGGGYITINSGIVEARTTTAGGAAAIGAGSSGTATSSSYKAVWGNIRINGGEVTAISSLTGDASAIGGGHNSYYSSSTYGSIGISGSAKVLAIGGTSGIGCGNNNENGTVSIADTANVVAISGNSATSPIKASVSGTTPAIVGAYLRSDSNRVNPGDTINIMESNANICNTFDIPSDISVTEDTRMAITTAGSTGNKYLQVERNGNRKPLSKVASPSAIEDYQYNAVRTITPDVEELYLVDIPSVAAPTSDAENNEVTMGESVTFQASSSSDNLWELADNTTWNDSEGLFNSSHNLGTGNSVTVTPLGTEGTTQISVASEIQLVGTDIKYSVNSPALTITVANLGEYDLRYGNIEVSPEDGYAFKVSFTDEDSIDRVKYFTSNKPITIYQSNGATTTTSNTINLNTDRVDVILGKTGSPINTTSSINCNGVEGSENSIRLILADGVTNTVKVSSSNAAIATNNGTDLTILTEQQFADPQHSGNYEGVGTLVATMNNPYTWFDTYAISSSNSVYINGGIVIATGLNYLAGGAISGSYVGISDTASVIAIGLTAINGGLANGYSYPRTVSCSTVDSALGVSGGDKVKIVDSSGNVQNEFIVPSEVTTARNVVATTSAATNYIIAEDNAGSGVIKTVAKERVVGSRDSSVYEYNSQNSAFNAQSYDALYYAREIPTLSAPILSSNTLMYGSTISATVGNLVGTDSASWSVDNSTVVWSESGEADLLKDISDASAIEANGDDGGETAIICTAKIRDNDASNPFPLAIDVTSEEATLTIDTQPIYDVYISWGSHNFTCTRAANGSFSWSQDAGEIGVDNRSNIPIRVRFSYEVDNNSNIHGINGSHEQQELTLARNNEDGHRNNKLNLTGIPFGLYTDGVMEHVGRSILNIERADG